MIADLYAKGESPHLANLGEREGVAGLRTVLLHVSAGDGGLGGVLLPVQWTWMLQERSCTGQGARPAVLVFLQESRASDIGLVGRKCVSKRPGLVVYLILLIGGGERARIIEHGGDSNAGPGGDHSESEIV